MEEVKNLDEEMLRVIKISPTPTELQIEKFLFHCMHWRLM